MALCFLLVSKHQHERETDDKLLYRTAKDFCCVMFCKENHMLTWFLQPSSNTQQAEDLIPEHLTQVD